MWHALTCRVPVLDSMGGTSLHSFARPQLTGGTDSDAGVAPFSFSARIQLKGGTSLGVRATSTDGWHRFRAWTDGWYRFLRLLFSRAGGTILRFARGRLTGGTDSDAIRTRGRLTGGTDSREFN